MKISIGISLIVSFLTTLLLLTFKAAIINGLNLNSIEPYIFLLPISMLFYAWMTTMNQWVIRKRLFNVSARASVFQAISLNSAKAGVGFFLPVSATLVSLAALSSVTHALLLWIGMLKTQPDFFLKKEFNFSTIKKLIFQYRDFCFYRTPQVALNSAAQSMPVLILANLFGVTAAGHYSLGLMVMLMPISLLGSAVGDVFYPKVSEAFNSKERIFNLLFKSTLALLCMGLLPFGIVLFFGPDIFSFVFGEKWLTAGEYASWLSIWLIFMLADQPAVKTLPVLSSQRFYLSYTVLTILARALALYLGSTLFEDDVCAIALFSITSMVLNIALILAIFRICLRHDNDLYGTEVHLKTLQKK